MCDAVSCDASAEDELCEAAGSGATTRPRYELEARRSLDNVELCHKYQRSFILPELHRRSSHLQCNSHNVRALACVAHHAIFGGRYAKHKRLLHSGSIIKSAGHHHSLSLILFDYTS